MRRVARTVFAAPSVTATIRGQVAPAVTLVRSKVAPVQSSPIAPTTPMTPTASTSSSASAAESSHTGAATSFGDRHVAHQGNMAEGGVPQVRDDARAHREVATIFQESISGPSGEDIGRLILECKHGKELRKIMEELVYPHPLMLDPLNGHGFRVFIVTRMTTTCAKIGEIDLWWDFLAHARAMDFHLTRTNVAIALDTVKKYIWRRFQDEGRNPNIAVSALRRARQLAQWAAEDGVPYDYVLHTRAIFIATSIVAIFDRQNLYRSVWPKEDVPRRDGVVPEWVVSHIRVKDYDFVVELVDKFVEEVIRDAMLSNNARPPFSFMLRLADYYFSTDNFHKMLAVCEDCRAMDISIAESTLAKLMQMATSFNIADAPRLLYEWRAQPSQCVLASPDMSRMMFFYARAGGGKPCPHCGEKYNHRYPHISVWKDTTEAQRSCPLLHDARVRKGVLEDNKSAPQCQDWSREGWACWELSRSRGVQWGMTEWRAFLLCNMFAPSEKALAAFDLLNERFPRKSWDDFVATQALRLLRHHAPERIVPTLKEWDSKRVKRSPLSLQEAAMGVLNIADDEKRLEALKFVGKVMYDHEVYTMPYMQRTADSFLKERTKPNSELKITEEEEMLLEDISTISPRQLSKADIKDSCSDILQGSTKRHTIYAEFH